MISDIIQVQFVNAAWKSTRSEVSPDLVQAPRARTAAKGIRARLRSRAIESYHEGMLNYQIAVERLVYTPRKTYIAIAQGVAHELRQCFGITKNVHVIHHGVDAQLFHPVGDPETSKMSDETERERLRASWNVGKDELVLLFVGAFERKGLAALIDSIGRIPRSISYRLKLVAVGNGDREAFGERARKLGIGERLVFTGHSRDVAKLYRAGDAFVMPTVYEPFGLVVLEAMASGLPVLVSKSAGASELIREGQNGLLIADPTDPEQVASSIQRLATDSELREKIGSLARETAASRSWDQVADEYATVIEPLLFAPGGA